MPDPLRHEQAGEGLDHELPDAQPPGAECNDDPKLTAEEWQYIEAMSTRTDP